jgi:hypothetical protein
LLRFQKKRNLSFELNTWDGPSIHGYKSSGGCNLKIQKNALGYAAKYAAASELLRRFKEIKISTETNGKPSEIHLKRKDKTLTFEVRGKQSDTWPKCMGIESDDRVMVFVDFKGKQDDERPDFYILIKEDWVDFLEREIIPKGRDEVIIDDHNIPRYRGGTYIGTGVKQRMIAQHKEKWDKIAQILL